MYHISYLASVVENDLPRIDPPVRKRIFRAIEKMARTPEMSGVSLRHDLKGFYKLRVGDWRVIYEIRQKELIILVIKIGHRRKVYEH